MRVAASKCQIVALLWLVVIAPVSFADGAGLEDTLLSHLRDLSTFDSRVTGYPGATAAADLIEASLRAAGSDTVYRRPIRVPVPVERGAVIV
ncbi:MAG: hypothetical protein VYD18_00965, partial [Candidatus Latescibacterota bacterium]|nr:hypothetical protein [Candidatus Latescibacterota bacterium]